MAMSDYIDGRAIEYVVEYEDKDEKVRIDTIEAKSLKDLAKKLLNMGALDVIEVVTPSEYKKITNRTHEVYEYMRNMKWYGAKKPKPFKAIVQEHEIIIVDKNGKIIDVAFSLTELKKKYPNIKLEHR